jgi:4'-phosphopantetheinyl transferase
VLRWEASVGRPAIAPGECQVIAFDLDAAALHIAELAALLSPDERARALRLVREADRHRFIAGRALLRRTLAGCLGVPAEAIRFDYSAAGKPALAAGFEATDLRFNASASGGVALVALRHGGDVGVDVERIRAARDGVAASAMTADEFAHYGSLAPAERLRYFTETWAAKEAVSKALGTGIRVGFSDFAVPATGGPVRWREDRDSAVRSPAWVVPLPSPQPGHAMAVAFTSPPPAIRLLDASSGVMAP